jgi:hypothetical protein
MLKYIVTTPEFAVVTLLGAIAASPEPHATTLPSDFSAAKAKLFEHTATKLEFAAVTLLGIVPP